MSKTIRKEAVYPHSPEKVWVAITDRRALAEWLMPNDFSPVMGHKFRFQTDPMPGCGTGIIYCEVLEVDPPRKLVYTWRQAERGESTVTWTLARDNGGTRLTLEHSGLEVFPFWQRFMLRFGWGTMVKRWIPKVAANVDSAGNFTPGAFPLEKRCYKCATVPMELTR